MCHKHLGIGVGRRPASSSLCWLRALLTMDDIRLFNKLIEIIDNYINPMGPPFNL